MEAAIAIVVTMLIGLAAALSAAAGAGGGAVFLAIAALVNMPFPFVRPTVFILIVIVGTSAAWTFCRAGHFSWRLFLPLISGALPGAFFAGRLDVPESVYKPVLSVLMCYAAITLWMPAHVEKAAKIRPMKGWAGVLSGFFIGCVTGLTGMGGGVLLTPVLLKARWAKVRTVAAVSALFTAVNAFAALAGQMNSTLMIAPQTGHWALAAGIGALAGAHLGSRHLPTHLIRRILAVILVASAIRLIF